MTKAFLATVLLGTLAIVPAKVPAAEFHRLGDDLAFSVSADGSRVVTNGNVWTREDGLIPYSPSSSATGAIPPAGWKGS